MIELIGYLLIVIGVGTAAAGYAVAIPGSFNDETKQAFWQAFGPYLLLIGAIVLICGLLVIRS